MDSKIAARVGEQMGRIGLAQRIVATRSERKRAWLHRRLVERCGSEYEASRVLAPLVAERNRTATERNRDCR